MAGWTRKKAHRTILITGLFFSYLTFPAHSTWDLFSQWYFDLFKKINRQIVYTTASQTLSIKDSSSVLIYLTVDIYTSYVDCNSFVSLLFILVLWDLTTCLNVAFIGHLNICHYLDSRCVKTSLSMYSSPQTLVQIKNLHFKTKPHPFSTHKASPPSLGAGSAPGNGWDPPGGGPIPGKQFP